MTDTFFDWPLCGFEAPPERVSQGSGGAIARWKHLFPFRTEQLSTAAPMVLGGQPPGRVGRRRFFFRRARPSPLGDGGSFFRSETVGSRRPDAVSSSDEGARNGRRGSHRTGVLSVPRRGVLAAGRRLGRSCLPEAARQAAQSVSMRGGLRAPLRSTRGIESSARPGRYRWPPEFWWASFKSAWHSVRLGSERDSDRRGVPVAAPRPGFPQHRPAERAPAAPGSGRKPYSPRVENSIARSRPSAARCLICLNTNIGS